jgi:hypothetical protein
VAELRVLRHCSRWYCYDAALLTISLRRPIHVFNEWTNRVIREPNKQSLLYDLHELRKLIDETQVLDNRVFLGMTMNDTRAALVPALLVHNQTVYMQIDHTTRRASTIAR